MIKILRQKYICNICDFITSKKTDFTRHLATDKHKKVVNGSKMVEKDCNLTTKNENKLYECKCGKTYKYDSGKN
jgi:hypothetical protein